MDLRFKFKFKFDAEAFVMAAEQECFDTSWGRLGLYVEVYRVDKIDIDEVIELAHEQFGELIQDET